MSQVRDLADVLPGMGRRRKTFRVSPAVILTLMGCWRKHDIIQLPVLELPADAVLSDVIYEPLLHAFTFLVYSETFPEVPEGEYAPAIEADWQTVELHGRFLDLLSRYVMERHAGLEVTPDEELLLEARRIVEAGVTRPPLSRIGQLERDLDGGRFATLHAIGDVLEEQGDGVLASGYHWLAVNKRWPAHHSGLYEWYCDGTYAASDFPTWGDRSRLPAEVYDGLPDAAEDQARIKVATVTESGSLRLAAQAAGAWLLEQETA